MDPEPTPTSSAEAGIAPSPKARRLPSPGAAVALFAVVLASNIAMSGLFEMLGVQGEWLLLTTPLLLIATTGAAVAIFRLAPRETLLLRWPSGGDLLMALPLAVSFVVLSDQLSSLTQQIVPVPEELAEGMIQLLRVQSAADWVLKVSTIGVLAAISEELLFRGFIQNGLLRGMSRSAAVLWTAFMFMLMHILPLPSFAAAGVVLGIVALSSRSIVVPVVVHFLNNVAALVLLNVAGVETLAEPVWIRPTILLPAIGIFVLTMGYYARRLVPEPGAEGARGEMEKHPVAPREPRSDPALRTRPTPSLSEELGEVPRNRRRLGWLVVAFAVTLGLSVLGGVFFSSIYIAFPKDVHASILASLQQESANRLALSAYDRAPDLDAAFDTLEAVNATGSLTGRDVWHVVLAYSRAAADGEIDSAEVDELVATIRRIVRQRTRPRRL